MSRIITLKKSFMAKAMIVCMIVCIIFGTFQLPAKAAATLVWPVPASYRITQGYHDNNAIDIGAAEGTAVVAAMGGKVTTIYKCGVTHHNYGDCNGFGTGLVILGDDGRAYQYAHMQAGSIPSNVYYGARVEAGQQIGRVGQTGYAYGAHLHFGISSTSKYWEKGPNPANETYGTPSANVSVGNQSATNISKNNAKLAGTLYKNPGTNCTACGIYLGTSSSNMTKRNTEAVGSAANNYNGGRSFDIWYDLTGELGIVLAPGTTYYYQIYGVVNGKEYRSPVSSFRTADDPQAVKPVVISKKTQPMKVSPGTKTYKYSTVKKRMQMFLIKVSKNKGKVTYKSSSKYIRVIGNIVTVKKGTPKGKYKVTVKAAGNSGYKAGSKTVTIVVK